VSRPLNLSEYHYVDQSTIRSRNSNHITFKSIVRAAAAVHNSFHSATVPGSHDAVIQCQAVQLDLYHNISDRSGERSTLWREPRLSGHPAFRVLIPVSSIGMNRFNSTSLLYSNLVAFAAPSLWNIA